MSVSLKGFQEKYVTMLAGEACTAGMPVNVTAADTAADCESGAFAGVCAAREGELALVQVQGFVTLPVDTTASALNLGIGQVVSSAGGKVKNGTGGRTAIVTAIRDGKAEMILL